MNILQGSQQNQPVFKISECKFSRIQEFHLESNGQNKSNAYIEMGNIQNLNNNIYFIEQNTKMFGSNQNSASVTLQVKGISEIRGVATNDKSVYTVVAQSYGKTLYGTNHIGNQSGWQDTFVINLKDLQNDDLTLTAFVNDNEVGSTNLSLYDISSTAAGNYESEYQIKLEKDGVPSGSLSVALQRLLKQQVIGGLAPPTITLRSDAVIVEEKGLQKISASKLNFFSCMDEKEKGWEFYPYKFKTRLRYNYSASQSLKSIMESNMQ